LCADRFAAAHCGLRARNTTGGDRIADTAGGKRHNASDRDPDPGPFAPPAASAAHSTQSHPDRGLAGPDADGEPACHSHSIAHTDGDGVS